MFHTIDLGMNKCFLLPCEGGWLLIDTASPEQYGSFRRRLANLGVDVRAVRLLLLTHHHTDHAGFAAQLLEESGANLICHRAALPFLAQGRMDSRAQPVNSVIGAGIGFIKRISNGSIQEDITPLAPRAGDFILDGDEPQLLPQFGVQGKILYTPGHTPDSISVVLKDGTAFCGDAAMSSLAFRLGGTHYRPILVTDAAQVQQSWSHLLENGAQRIYPAHGAPFSAQVLAR